MEAPNNQLIRHHDPQFENYTQEKEEGEGRGVLGNNIKKNSRPRRRKSLTDRMKVLMQY